MKKLLIIIAYIWAFACVLLIPLTFMGNANFAKQLAKLPFMKINPVFSGGEVARSFENNGLKVVIYKPVFAALIGESKSGFVQIKFSDDNQLPKLISQEIDYNNDGKTDFNININTVTGETKLEPLNGNVKSMAVSAKVKMDWIIRINIHK